MSVSPTLMCIFCLHFFSYFLCRSLEIREGVVAIWFLLSVVFVSTVVVRVA